jgi:predicted RND superfamily exporter protein
MWKFLSSNILRYRYYYLVVVFALTAVMGFLGTKIKLSYEFAKVLPANDSTLIYYENFKKQFGEDGSVMVIGFEDEQFFTTTHLTRFNRYTDALKKIDGVKQILSINALYNIERNDSLHKLEVKQLRMDQLQSQAEVDSIRELISGLPFYKGLIYHEDSGAFLVAITFNDKALNSSRRIEIVNEIQQLSDAFSKESGVKLHFSGMPYIRTVIMKKVTSEMAIFMVLAVVVMAIALWLFFRTFSSVLLSIVVVLIGVVWSLGLIYLFDYRITLLTGLVPALIMVIGVPNCVFLINKYHQEFSRHGNKMKSLSRMIQTIGITLFLANVTTAIGFGVLYFTGSALLVEFGIVAAIAVMLTYMTTLVLIPIVLSFMKEPDREDMKHLEARRLGFVLDKIDYMVHHHRNAIYMIVTVFTLVSLLGFSRINIITYIVDDLPKKDPVYADLRFFEQNFHGVLPFEIVIDTREKNGIAANNAAVLYKIQRLQRMLAEYPQFSRAVSVVDMVKFSNQALHDGERKHFILPGYAGLQELTGYMDSVQQQKGLLKGFVDSSLQTLRVSAQVADIGSKELKRITDEIHPRIDSIFPKDEYNVHLTGHSYTFMKSNDYLLYNLIESLLIEIILITIVGFALFRSIRIILLSKIPVLVPLIITAGVMGFLDITFRPSTILIFSVAFGISSDGTIYFLTRYRQILRHMNISVSEAISLTIRDTGISMVYTTIILFFGFAVFTVSGFGGTVALGTLLSITLLVSMFTNLILLPSILLSINTRQLRKEMEEQALIDIDEDKVEE